jgi:predicted flap endonuclease-1-like 5' DNA nuclease
MLSAFFTCYLWWLLAGFLLGWLCNWLLCKCCGNNNTSTTATTHTNVASTTAKAAAFTAAPVAAAAAVAASVAAPVIDLAAAKAAGISVKGADDLEVIEGIGPKICGLFHAAGQKTFTQVSQMSIQQMSKILDDAGPRFKLANPETWAQQASLAANNRWAELKTLQDNLTAGVTTQQDRSEL